MPPRPNNPAPQPIEPEVFGISTGIVLNVVPMVRKRRPAFVNCLD